MEKKILETFLLTFCGRSVRKTRSFFGFAMATATGGYWRDNYGYGRIWEAGGPSQDFSKQVSPESTTYKPQYNHKLGLNVYKFEKKCLFLEARI